MIDHFYSEPTLLQRWRRGPLGPHLDRFASLLIEQGYSRSAGREKIRLVVNLSRWLDSKRTRLEELNEQQVTAFLVALRKRQRPGHGDQSTLAFLLRHLRKAGIIPAVVDLSADGPVDLLVRDYARFLIQERGLSQATLGNYLPIARRFLSKRFQSRKVRLDTLRSRDVNKFILGEIPNLSRRRVQLVTTALRSFLGFLFQHGHLGVALSASVPTVASWRSSDLPQFLEPDQVERLLQRCDQTSPCGQRDHAVLLLLARLGLRAGEVVHLRLDDINWEAGEVLIRGKSSRMDRLPLPHDVGRALATYLKKGRPGCSSRRVFIRAVAPRDGFAGSSTICCIVRRALARARIRPAHQGAHLLRHSLATRMLRGGASLTQIGQILRHQRTETTEIYAKVDLRALHGLVQPWPGGVR
jgi:site-specific recombinase XerD